MQRRITEPGPLHDESGRLIETGYATSLIRTYDRSRVKASRLRLKEWDYYCVCSDQFAFALTVAHNGYMTMDSISLIDFESNSQQTTSKMYLPPFSKRDLPPTSASGDVRVRGKGYSIAFENDGVTRRLCGRMADLAGGKPVSFDIRLSDAPEESMVIVTPFLDAPRAFYYNQKINCMRASGFIQCGDRSYVCEPDRAFAVLDWGRGVWTYDNTWYWGSGNTDIDGNSFGFNIGYGFGNTAAASENVIFYNGKAHKLDDVTFHIPETGYMDPWKFTSSDGRFEMDFIPVLDRAANLDFKAIVSDQHQVFGRMSGTAILDDGTSIQIRDVLCFAEKVHNRY